MSAWYCFFFELVAFVGDGDGYLAVEGNAAMVEFEFEGFLVDAL